MQNPTLLFISNQLSLPYHHVDSIWINFISNISYSLSNKKNALLLPSLGTFIKLNNSIILQFTSSFLQIHHLRQTIIDHDLPIIPINLALLAKQILVPYQEIQNFIDALVSQISVLVHQKPISIQLPDLQRITIDKKGQISSQVLTLNSKYTKPTVQKNSFTHPKEQQNTLDIPNPNILQLQSIQQLQVKDSRNRNRFSIKERNSNLQEVNQYIGSVIKTQVRKSLDFSIIQSTKEIPFRNESYSIDLDAKNLKQLNDLKELPYYRNKIKRKQFNIQNHNDNHWSLSESDNLINEQEKSGNSQITSNKMIEIKQIIQSDFIKLNVLKQKIPILIDAYSRTLSCPISNQANSINECHRIGSNYNLNCQNVYIDLLDKCIRVKPKHQNHQKITSQITELFDHLQYDQTSTQTQINSQDSSKQALYDRFWFISQNCIPDNHILPFEQSFIKIKFNSINIHLKQEIIKYYICFIKQAILNYILLDDQEKYRLAILPLQIYFIKQRELIEQDDSKILLKHLKKGKPEFEIMFINANKYKQIVVGEWMSLELNDKIFWNKKRVRYSELIQQMNNNQDIIEMKLRQYIKQVEQQSGQVQGLVKMILNCFYEQLIQNVVDGLNTIGWVELELNLEDGEIKLWICQHEMELSIREFIDKFQKFPFFNSSNLNNKLSLISNTIFNSQLLDQFINQFSAVLNYFHNHNNDHKLPTPTQINSYISQNTLIQTSIQQIQPIFTTKLFLIDATHLQSKLQKLAEDQIKQFLNNTLNNIIIKNSELQDFMDSIINSISFKSLTSQKLIEVETKAYNILNNLYKKIQQEHKDNFVYLVNLINNPILIDHEILGQFYLTLMMIKELPNRVRVESIKISKKRKQLEQSLKYEIQQTFEQIENLKNDIILLNGFESRFFCNEIMEKIGKFVVRLIEIERREKQIQEEVELLQQEQIEFCQLSEIQEDLKLFKMIWSCVSDFEHKWKEWMKHRLIDIDFLRLNLELEKMKIMIERVKNEISKDTSKVGQLKLMNELDSDLKQLYDQQDVIKIFSNAQYSVKQKEIIAKIINVTIYDKLGKLIHINAVQYIDQLIIH